MAAGRRAATAALVAVGCFAGSGSVAQKKPQTSPPAQQTKPVVDYARRFASECSECHGATGRSDMAGVPVLAGQHSLYAITQLFLFREGRRDFAPMVALAKRMSDDDLRGFSEAIGRLPAVAPPTGPAPDPTRMRSGLALAQQHRCMLCHGGDLAGGQQVPRIGGQKEEYLRLTLHGYKSGQRPGYTRAMSEALSAVEPKDLDLLAYFVAHAGRGDAATAPAK